MKSVKKYPAVEYARIMAGLPVLAVKRAVGVFLGKPATLTVPLFHDIPLGERDKFESLIEYLHSNYQIIFPEQLDQLRSGGLSESRGSRYCLITFDDGFSSDYGIVLNVLKKYGIKALFFICPGIIEKRASEQGLLIKENIGNPREGLSLMSWGQLAELLGKGHAVGCHTSFHRRLTDENLCHFQEEIVGAKALIKERLGVDTRWFAYPFGDAGSICRDAVSLIRNHYDYCFSGVRGINTEIGRGSMFFRQSIDLGRSLYSQKLFLQGAFDPLYKGPRRKLKALDLDF
ncbi:MAG: polysaccharide deacetylase family protein [Oligoflexales bacterium]|nr:polysaccharide deacetylase family protein [Oligoflexales bacterium]